jgi:rfaE bifunctional protein kinase chain/domain
MLVKEIIEKIENVKVLVIGDIFLDKYLFGKASRISAEAPVPIVLHEENNVRLGGAGNTALNAKNLLASVSLAGFIGKDKDGLTIIDLLDKNKISHEGISTNANFTIVKERIMANDRQVVRVDYEKEALKNIDHSCLLEFIIWNSENFDVCIISDYNKGTITENIIKNIECSYIIADTKGNPEFYKGIKAITPNIVELMEIAKRYNIDNSLDIHLIARKLIEILNLETIIVTLGEQGALLVTKTEELHCPSLLTHVYDVSGAGDTFVASYALAKYVGGTYVQSVAFASLMAASVLSEVGTTPINLEKILTLYGEFDLGKK